MRGEAEKECLKHLKISILDPDAVGKQRMNCNYWCKGFDNINNAVFSARLNSDLNRFPDFLFKGGFIEHFIVTAAKETKKGSKYKEKEAIIDRNWERLYEMEKEEFLKSSFVPRQMTIITKREKMLEFSYENYKKSFHKNWENHIDSLKKYSGAKDMGIFLVEYQGALLKKMVNGNFKGFYHLHMDKEMLAYIYRWKEFLKYLIFVDGQHYEMISFDEIPSLIKNIPKGIIFDPGVLKKGRINIFFDF